MSEKDSTESAFPSHSVYFILVIYWIYIWVVSLTYFTLMNLMTLINDGNRLISLSLHVLVQNKWAIRMYFKGLSSCVLFELDFRIYLKVIFFLRLFLYLHSERWKVICLCGFCHYNRLIRFCQESSDWLLPWFINFHFWIIFAWRKSVPKVHFVFLF